MAGVAVPLIAYQAINVLLQKHSDPDESINPDESGNLSPFFAQWDTSLEDLRVFSMD